MGFTSHVRSSCYRDRAGLSDSYLFSDWAYLLFSAGHRGSPPPLQLLALGLECAGQVAQHFAVATFPAVALNLGLSCGAYRPR